MTLPPALVIAGKDLRLRFRDRSAIMLGFVAPLLIATVMSLAFKSSENFHMTVGVVNADRSTVGKAMVDALRSDQLRSIVTVRIVSDEATAARLVRKGTVAAGLVIPDGFTESITGAEPIGLRVLTSVDTPLAGQVTRSIATSFAAQIDADRLSVATAIDAGASVAPSDLATLSARATRQQLPISVTGRRTGARPLKAVSYFAPAMGIFFLFFAISFTAHGWFLEARDGNLQRMAAATSLRQILVGKAVSVFVFGTASLTTMAVLTTLVFGADWGGPGPAAALIVAMVLAVVCLTALVIVVARTDRQAEALGSIIVFGLALLGGNFVFVSTAPPLLRRLALFTPNGWTIRGFVDLATGPHTMAAIWQPLGGIFAFSAVVLAITAALSKRMVLP
ncbi:MAG: ABC transporter permease [Acidimicrobiales bacterium]